jgi:hypothetical protein
MRPALHELHDGTTSGAFDRIGDDKHLMESVGGRPAPGSVAAAWRARGPGVMPSSASRDSRRARVRGTASGGLPMGTFGVARSASALA